MDDINSHVSLKIRSAIKAKLVELGTYVDNELPDYIMVLVVNKKTKEQMDNDLSLFLGHNTEHFTSWLSSVLEKLNSAAVLTSSAPVPPSAPEKEIVKVKEEPVTSIVVTDSSKVDNKTAAAAAAAETIVKEKEGKEKKKSKEKKLKKREKKKKKKERKELEKKMKKEAKKKSAEGQELLNKENKNSSPITEQPKVITVTETKKGTEAKIGQDAPAKRKRSSSHGSESDSNIPATKRTVVEALGKNKTLTITKTIRNEHHKPNKPVNSNNAIDRHSSDPEISGDKSNFSVQKSTAKPPKKTAKIVLSSDDEKEAATAEEVEKPGSTDGEEVVEEGPEDQSSECAATDEPTEDIVDFKVGEAELEQELQEDEELVQEDEKERKELKAHSLRKSAKAAHRSSKPKQKTLSVMDRLGPPRPTKHSCSSPEEEEAASDDPESRHSADEVPSKAAKRRVINLLEESSFPPRRSSSEKRPVSSKVVAPVAPGKKLEARVRPLSVVEKTSRTAESSPSRPPLSSLSRRHYKDKGVDESSSNTEECSGTAALQSKVEVTGRERRTASSHNSSSGRRAPNSALILRAVADAHRSVTSAKRTSAQLLDDQTHHKASSKSSKKPKLEVFSRSYREREEGRLNSSNGSTSSTSSSSPLKDTKIQKLSITVPNPPRSTLRDGLTDPTSDDDIRKPSALERLSRSSPKSSSIKRRLEVPEHVPRNRYLVDDVIEDDNVRARLQPRPSVVVAPQVLDANMEEVEEYIEEVEEWEEDVESVGRAPSVDPITAAAAPITDPLLLPLDQIVKQQNLQSEAKYSTRCMYWPGCRLGDKCQYQHPSVPCKMFPNCQFGDKCLYIHPNCKFDALCSRPDCPFTHASPRPASQIPGKSKLSLNTTVPAARPKSAVALKKCHYGLKCTNHLCPFLHPKPCKFGSACLTPGCQFSHPDVSTGAKLKWVAPKLSNATVTAKATVKKAPDSSTGHTTRAEKVLPDSSVKLSNVSKLVANNGCAKADGADQTKVSTPITAE
ncbi:Zinc finger CCCH-type [Trinorchestia longiramus]|nr:Zinc finger CCCH-type [Trinorchestia longiramus]